MSRSAIYSSPRRAATMNSFHYKYRKSVLVVRALFFALLCVGPALVESQQAPQGTNPGVEEKQIQQPDKQAGSGAPAGFPEKSMSTTAGVIAGAVQPVVNCNAECSKPQPDRDWWHQFRTDPLATFTGLLFVATVLLWLSTRALVKGADKTARRQLRAYVFVDGENMRVNNLLDGGDIGITYWIRNYGQTPAYELAHRSFVAFDVFPSFTPPSIDIREKPLSKMILPPGGGSHKSMKHDKLNPEQLDGLLGQRFTFYIFGKIAFKDCFGTDQWATYRFMLVKLPRQDEFTLVSCADGNEAS